MLLLVTSCCSISMAWHISHSKYTRWPHIIISIISPSWCTTMTTNAVLSQWHHDITIQFTLSSSYHHPIIILIWRFPIHGGTPKSSIYRWDCPWNKPSGDQGVPHYHHHHHHHHPDMTIIFYHQLTLWLLFPVYHHPITILSPSYHPVVVRDAWGLRHSDTLPDEDELRFARSLDEAGNSGGWVRFGDNLQDDFRTIQDDLAWFRI